MDLIEKIRARKFVVRATVYARFSSDNQREESIDAQLRAAREYAKKNDIVIVSEYIDKAKSAMTDKRDEFLRMVADAKEDYFDLVLVHKLDRFARSRKDSICYRLELKRHDVSLISILEYLDDSPESIILESVLEAMAEYYSKNLSREIKKGMNENALKGLHTGGKPPLGYDLDPKTKMLVINEKEALAVRLIFRLFNEGNGYMAIIKELNIQGYRTKLGGSFGKNSLYNIVRNEKYTGVYIFNKLVSRNDFGKRNGNKYKDDDEIVRIEGTVPPLISKEVYALAIRRIKKRKVPRYDSRTKEVYLLSGKTVCGECGYVYNGNRKMSGRKKTLHVTYRCGGRDKKRNCTNKEIRREYIEAFVLEMLANYIFDERMISRVLDQNRNYQLEKNSEIINTRENIKKQVESLDKKISNLVDLVVNSGSPTLAKKLSELETDKIEAESRYNQICSEYEIRDVSREQLKDSFAIAKKLLMNKKLSTAKKLVEYYIDKVLIFGDKVEVYFNFHQDLDLPELPYQKKRTDHMITKKDPAISSDQLSQNLSDDNKWTSFMLPDTSKNLCGYAGGGEGS